MTRSKFFYPSRPVRSTRAYEIKSPHENALRTIGDAVRTEKKLLDVVFGPYAHTHAHTQMFTRV